MALITRIPIAEVAAVVARSLEDLLGHDVVLTTGPAEIGDPSGMILPEGMTRTIVLPFAAGVVGEVSLIVDEMFATAMEAATSDASLSSAAVPVLNAGAAAIALTIDIGVSVDGAGEIATETLLTSVVGEFAAVPVLENDTRVACVVVRIVDDELDDLTPPAPAATPAFLAPSLEEQAPAPAIPSPPRIPTVAVAPVPALGAPATGLAPAPASDPRVGVAPHEFQPLADGAGAAGPARPIALLNDVNMQVTAELGRRRLKVREIIALQPGSVIELDRAAGSPVDVLVNGAIVWHGEVVVVDEEFGIRVSEIVVGEG
jgi:flagellar motor switch protein FliN